MDLINKKFNLNSSQLFLIAILVIAFILRVFNLHVVPLGLYLDEASIGYNAYSISETLRDEYGNLLPVYFEAFGEYKNPVIIYFAAILIKLFGPHVLVLRLSSALLGLLAVYFTYKLTLLYLSERVALLAAFLLAISPWHIVFSRYVVEPIAYPTFLLMGLYFFKKGLLDEKNKKYLILSSIPVALSVYSYGIGKLFTPLLFFVLTLLNFKAIWRLKKQYLIFLSIVILLLSPIVYQMQIKPLQGRFSLLAINNEFFCLRNERKKYHENNLHFIAKNDKFLIFSVFVENYFKHMSPDFLAISGDRNLRHHVGHRGELLLFTFIFCLVGVLALLCGKNKLLIFSLWFLLFPIPASLTWESLPHAARAISGLPVFQILAAVGFFVTYDLINSISKKWVWKNISFHQIFLALFLILCSWLLIIDSFNFIRRYFTTYAQDSMAWFNYDDFAIAKETKKYKKQYHQIILPHGYNPIIYLFTQKINPKLWQNGKVELPYISRIPTDALDEKLRYLKIAIPDYNSDEKVIAKIRDPFTGGVRYDISEVDTKLKNVFFRGKLVGGLLGEYFIGDNFNRFVFKRVDKNISKEWSFGSPSPNIMPDHFSVKWTGWFYAEKEGLYQFFITGDDGMRLIVDEKILVNDWHPHPPTEFHPRILLKQGWHPIEIHYYDFEGFGSISFKYKEPGGMITMVPSKILAPRIID